MQILKRTLAAAAALTLVATAAAAQPSTPDFSGQWEMNAAKSDFGQMPAPSKAQLTVEQSTTSFKFTQVVGTPAGDQRVAVEIPFTATDSTYTGADGQPVTTNTKVEAGVLVVNAKLQRQGADITQTSRWSLSPDGKTLTLDQQVGTPMGAMALKIVFDKK